MKSLKKFTAISIAFLIAIFASVSAFAETYYVFDHYTFSKNSDGTIEIADYDNSSENMVIPSSIIDLSVSSIARLAFFDNNKIISATLPDTLSTIKDSAFYRAQNLTSINIPVNCTRIDKMAFQYCSSLKEVKFESELTAIETQIFYGCSSLEEIELPKTVESIGEYAFGACTSLEKILIPKATTTIAANAFYNTPNVTIYGYRNSYAQTYADKNKIPFVIIDDVDKTELEKVLISADTILSDNNSPYTEESLENLRNAVLTGKNVFADDYVSQNDVDKATADIQSALQDLVFVAPECIYGDTNLDGSVEIDDATYIQRYIAEYISFSSVEMITADVNLDGTINIDDVTAIQRYLAGYEIDFIGQKVPADEFLSK